MVCLGSEIEEERMSETVSVEVARYRERDLLGKALAERGYTARPVEETARLGFEIDCDDSDRSCNELMHELELLVDQLGTPFIPQRGDGLVFLRPPSN
jgi:hypothetical protein